jgi:hypothetical protein
VDRLQQRSSSIEERLYQSRFPGGSYSSPPVPGAGWSEEQRLLFDELLLLQESTDLQQIQTALEGSESSLAQLGPGAPKELRELCLQVCRRY